MKLDFITHSKQLEPATLIAAGIAAAGSAANAYGQARSNLRGRQFAEEMYLRQRADSLEDWNRVNAYNSPAEQMKRMKAAGINPHEAFGAQGNTADPVRSSQAQSWKPDAVNFDAGAVSGAYFNTKFQQQQMDNMEKQRELVAAQVETEKARKLNTDANTASTTQDTRLKDVLSSHNLEKAILDNERTAGEISANAQRQNLDLQRNEREIAAQKISFQEAAERILKSRSDRATSEDQRANLKEATSGVKLDNRIKELAIAMKEKGIEPGDPLWSRALARAIDWLITKGADTPKIPETKTPFNADIQPNWKK